MDEGAWTMLAHDVTSHLTVRRTGFRRFVVLTTLTLLVSVPRTALSLPVELWPLVKSAEGAVWGQLTEIQLGDEDRLLVIAVDEVVAGPSARGTGFLRLLDRAGRLPDGTSLAPGDTGLFLFGAPHEDRPQLPCDAWFIAGGHLPAPADVAERTRATALLAAALSGAPAPTSTRWDVIALLQAPTAAYRRLAICALLESPPAGRLEERQVATSFREERDAQNLCRYLDLFLLLNRPLAGEGISSLILGQTSSELHCLALAYMERYGTDADRATLLAAYPRATRELRVRLLEAYGRLQLVEAAPWWRQALSGEDPELLLRALELLPLSGLPETCQVYEQLLDSEELGVRVLAVRGLASVATGEARTIIDRVAAGRDDDPLSRLARDALRHPFRHGTVRNRAAAGDRR